MKSLSLLFSSKARIHVLRVLSGGAGRFALRQIEKLTGLPVYSVQYALGQLLDEKLVTVQSISGKTLYALNPRHIDFDFINFIFEAERHRDLEGRAKQMAKTPFEVMLFNDQIHHLYSGVRS